MNHPNHPPAVGARAGRLAPLLIALALAGLPSARARAQVAPASPMSALPAPLDDMTDVREPSGLDQITPAPPASTASFIDRLKANDAAFKVVVGQGRILATRADITAGQAQASIAVGDPSVVDFTVISARQVRIVGQRIGVTDLSITTAGGQNYSFEVQVVADLEPLAARLRASFPDANLRLAQLRDSVVVEGQARDAVQVENALRMIRAYLDSVQVGQARKVRGQQGPVGVGPPGGPFGSPASPDSPPPAPSPDGTAPATPPGVGTETGPPLQVEGDIAAAQVINLIRIPGAQQVLLKVRVAELNRSALRRIGANFLGVDPRNGSIVGTQIAGPITAAGTVIGSNATSTGLTSKASRLSKTIVASAVNPVSANSTVFGIFQDADFEFTLNALRQNSMLKVLAEPNLVALHGHEASFLAGGEFPVPVPQVSSSGVAPTVTVRFREFGVRLNFLPHILDDDVIQLKVAPEVSQIDFTIATTLVAGGTPVPGLNTRKAQTTVELREGQTLAIAGLMQLTLDGSTNRVPGLGDLPILGPLFSNTESSRVEKELVVLVTPYLVTPMNKGMVPPTPGDEVYGPNDLEFFFLNRIEGRTGRDFRATTAWDDPLNLVRFLNLQRRYVNGPSGFSD